MPPLPSRVKPKRVWCPSLPGRLFDDDVNYLRAHIMLGKPVDGAFLSWVLDTLEEHRDAEWQNVDDVRSELKTVEEERDDIQKELDNAEESLADLKASMMEFQQRVRRLLRNKFTKADIEAALDDFITGD